MPASLRYCSHCGAANAVENQLCFACHLPLASPEETEQSILLNGRYRLLTQVGSGGFGGVYRAIDTIENRQIVAVKQINLRGLSAQEVIEATDAFNREVHLLSVLQHPNLPTMRATFTDQEHWYLVMDFIDGQTLEEYLKNRAGSGLPLKDALAISLQLCTVLDYLHTRQPAIIFRDLKPSNVMRTPKGHIYLIDFGIARHFSPGKPKDTMPFGSPGYAAPEQYGKAQTTPQADIYSLGALLHHLLTGNDPAESPFRFAPLPMADDVELARLDALIQHMVATEPGERPASIAEVKITLQSLFDTIQRAEFQVFLGDPPQKTIFTAPVPMTRRRVLTGALQVGGVVIGVGGVVGLCAVGGQFLFRRRFSGTGPAIPPSPGVAKQQFIYRGHSGPITAVSWSPDGTMVSSGSADGTVQVWRASDGALLYTLSGYYDPVTSVVWATDRVNVIASAGNDDGTVQVWDALRDHRDLIFQGEGRALALSWQRKSPWIVSGGTDDEIYTWNATTGAKGASYKGHKGNVKTVTWLPPSTNVFTATPIASIDTPTATTGLPISRQVIASGGADSTVQLWDANTGQHILTYTGHQAGVNDLALLSYSANEETPPEFIASASDDGTVHVWDLNSEPGIARTVYSGHRGKVNALAALPSVSFYGPRIASAGDDRTVQIWNISKELLTTYTAHHAPIKALAASPVDERIVSGDTDGLVHLWTVTRTGYQ